MKRLLGIAVCSLAIVGTVMAFDGKCPICKATGQTSDVYQGMTSETLLGWIQGYYDTNGVYQSNPNPNTTTTEYGCSQGHHFSICQQYTNENIHVDWSQTNTVGQTKEQK